MVTECCVQVFVFLNYVYSVQFNTDRLQAGSAHISAIINLPSSSISFKNMAKTLKKVSNHDAQTMSQVKEEIVVRHFCSTCS